MGLGNGLLLALLPLQGELVHVYVYQCHCNAPEVQTASYGPLKKLGTRLLDIFIFLIVTAGLRLGLKHRVRLVGLHLPVEHVQGAGFRLSITGTGGLLRVCSTDNTFFI